MDELKPNGNERKSKTIFRVEKNKDNPYVMIDKRPLENSKLSWKAKGILAYILSRPDDWTIRFQDLVGKSPDGAHLIRAALKELRKAGHLQVETIREGGKIKQWIYRVYEIPHRDFQQVENLLVGNRTFNNNDSTNKNEIVTSDFVSRKLVELCGGAVNSYTAQYLTEWFEIHEPRRVLQAIQEAEARGAKSPQYVDKVLRSWEEKGQYPPTLEERKAAAENSRKNGNGSKKGNGRSTPPAQDDFMEKLAERKARLEAEASV